MEYKVEVANKSDNKKIIDFLRNYSKEFGFGKVENREDIMKCPDFFHERNGTFYLIKNEDKKIIGSVGIHELYYNLRKSGFLRRLYVEKDFRGFGLGKRLLKEAEDFCKKQGFGYLIFGVDKLVEEKGGVRKFYIKNGYEEFFVNVPQHLLDDNDEWYYRKKIN